MLRIFPQFKKEHCLQTPIISFGSEHVISGFLVNLWNNLMKNREKNYNTHTGDSTNPETLICT